MTGRSARLLLLLAAATGLAAAATPIDPALVAADGSEGRRPRAFAWDPGGTRLAYLYDGGDGPGLFVTDAASGTTRQELPPGALPGGPGGAPRRISRVAWSPLGNSLLIEAGGDLFLQPLGQPEPRRLTESAAEEKGAAISPDGTLVAFSREGDLYVLDLASGEERALTRDGKPGAILNGDTDWVYWEEIWGRDAEAFWWSPDGRRIAYYRFDDTAVESFPIAGEGRPYPDVRWQKYPKAGRQNPAVRVAVVDVASGETVFADTGPVADAYLARVDWLPSSGAIYVQRLDRDQTHLALLRCEAGTGACTTVLEENWPTWINVEKDFRVLADGRFIWGSERTGWRHLYLYDAEGTLVRPLTSGDWAVTSVDAVDEARGIVLFTATGAGELGAAERQIHRVSLEGGAPERLTRRAGWHGAVVAPRTGHWVHTFSDADHPPEVELLRADGTKVELPHEPPRFDPDALPRWEFFTIRGEGDVRYPARMLRPEKMAGIKRHPVIMYHYGGPGSQVVVHRWDSRGRGLWHKMMAQRGYLVLSVDNRASIFFGKRGEDLVHRRFGEINLEAQLAAVRYLRGLASADAGRIGLWGWSGGGANTLYCLLRSPGVWRAGVAGAPVTDWTLYDTIWTERYLDRPQENEEGYRDSSPITYAGKLADALLVVHGTADDNVHMQNTLALADALVEAGKPFEMAIYPGQKHGFRGAALRHFYARMTEFFERQLAGQD